MSHDCFMAHFSLHLDSSFTIVYKKGDSMKKRIDKYVIGALCVALLCLTQCHKVNSSGEFVDSVFDLDVDNDSDWFEKYLMSGNNAPASEDQHQAIQDSANDNATGDNTSDSTDGTEDDRITDASGAEAQGELDLEDDEDEKAEGDIAEKEEGEDHDDGDTDDEGEEELETIEIHYLTFAEKFIELVDGTDGEFHLFIKNMDTAGFVSQVDMQNALLEYKEKLQEWYSKKADPLPDDVIDLWSNVNSLEKEYSLTLVDAALEDMILLSKKSPVYLDKAYSKEVSDVQQFFNRSNIVLTDDQLNKMYELLDYCAYIVSNYVASIVKETLLCLGCAVGGAVIVNLKT